MIDVKRMKIIILGLICCGLVFLGITCYSQGESGELEVFFFDVNQGDAALIKSPYGQKILIDGGPDRAVLGKLAREMPFYDKVIDLVVLTHPHSDHVSGLVEVLKKYKIEKVMSTGVAHTTKVYEEFLRLIQQAKIDVVQAPDCRNNISNSALTCLPQEIVLGKDLKMQIIWPREDLSGTQQENLNNSSIVVKLNYRQVSFLLVGDIEEEVEDELLEHYVGAPLVGARRDSDQIGHPQGMSDITECRLLRADVLKVAHQGSDSSSQEAFLQQILPKYAIISVGKNAYGHPSRRVIRRLEKLGVEVLRTDLVGDILCESLGAGVECLAR